MKKRKIFKSFFTSLMALVLCLGSVPPTFAADGNNSGDENTPATLTIEKNLQMPAGTTTPDVTFNFNLEPETVNDSKYSAATDTTTANMPKLTNVSVTYSSADAGETENGIKTVTITTSDLIKYLTFTHAGTYVYTLTETADTTNSSGTITYSDASYEITVYVANKDGGPGVYVSNVISTLIVADKKTKADVVFTNLYFETTGSEKQPALKISKEVSGKYADQEKYFPFAITLNKTTADAEKTTYKLYLYENGVLQSSIPSDISPDVTKDTEGNDYISVTSGSDLPVNLKHGQTLSVLSATVGTTYTVVEAAAAGYTGSVTLSDGINDVTKKGDTNTKLSTDLRLIRSGANSAAFTNTREDMTPTGISMNILPFVMILVLAAAALTVFVVAKSRKKNYNTED